MSSNIGGSGGRGRNALSSVDFYRRVPRDLTEVRERKNKNKQTKTTRQTETYNHNKHDHPYTHLHTHKRLHPYMAYTEKLEKENNDRERKEVTLERSAPPPFILISCSVLFFVFWFLLFLVSFWFCSPLSLSSISIWFSIVSLFFLSLFFLFSLFSLSLFSLYTILKKGYNIRCHDEFMCHGCYGDFIFK